jgi:ribosomal-protein-alanine N-acetyltransferase
MLIGKKICLRPITIEDANDIYVSWLNDKEVNQFLESRFVFATKENVKNFIETTISSDSNVFFAICEMQNNRHIGNIKLGPINKYHKRADIGILIGEKSCWGKGYGAEAIKLITEYAFDILGLKKVNAGCYSNNFGSEKAFQNAGFQREGLFRSHFLSVSGEWVDLIYFAMYNEREI